MTRNVPTITARNYNCDDVDDAMQTKQALFVAKLERAKATARAFHQKKKNTTATTTEIMANDPEFASIITTMK